jgi:hypothetical protein
MRIKGGLVKGLLIALAITLTPAAAISAQKVTTGSKCKVQKQKVIYLDKSYTCIKTGKKLVWNKGVVVKVAPVAKPSPSATSAPTPSATPSPSPTPSATPSPSPTPIRPQLTFIEMLRSPMIDGKFPIEYQDYPKPTKIPSSWIDVYENREGIAYKAWLSMSKTIAASNSSLGLLTVNLGPNSTLPYKELQGAMDLVSRGFPNTKQPSKINLIAFNFTDQMWADELYRKLIANEPDSFKRNHQDIVIDMCQKNNRICWSEMGLSNTAGDGVILLGIVESDKLRQLDPSYASHARSNEGLTVAHEYFHTMQRKLIDKNWFQMQYAPPSWFHEATAIFVENSAMNHASFDKYMRFRAVDSKLAYPSCGPVSQGCISVTQEEMTDFLSLTHYSNNWNKFPYGMKYEVSSRVVEVLVALKGHESITDVYTYMAQNHTFEEAFQHIYGISYSSAIPILAKIVSEQFANNL